MQSLIKAIQKDALDSNVPIVDLLRKAYLLSKKLSLGEYEEWLSNELSGYNCRNDNIPNYRVINGRPECKSFPDRWMEVFDESPEIMAEISKVYLHFSVSELTEIASTGKIVYMPFPRALRNQLSGYDDRFGTLANRTAPYQLRGVLDTIRTKILDWVCLIEGFGVTGGELDFNEEEKASVQNNSTVIHNWYINNIQAEVVGVQQGNSLANQQIGNDIKTIDMLIEKAKQIFSGIPENNELKNLIAEINSEKEKPNFAINKIRSLLTRLYEKMEEICTEHVADATKSAISYYMAEIVAFLSKSG